MAQVMAEPYVRPSDVIYFETGDAEAIKREIDRIGAKSVLEFGPGDSTQALLNMGIERIVTCEHIPKWRAVAKKRFKKEPRVTVLPFTNTVPVKVKGLADDERFDLGFVDTPQGFREFRVIHPEFPDCSRMNTCLFALERCKSVLLHDARRCCERATLGRLWAMGYKYEFVNSRIGMARIWDEKQNGPDSPGIAESRGSPPRTISE